MMNNMTARSQTMPIALTERQEQIVHLIIEGKTNKEISNELKKDIEDLQWAADSKESFLNVTKLLEKKYLEKDSDQIPS